MLKRTCSLQTSAVRNWSSTLHLPRSTFNTRPLISERARLLERCTDDLYQWQKDRRGSGNGTFVLHDGPPYANGSLHIGHALNKILKDIICRFQATQGRKVHFVPGWDCHGLPIEVKALQGLGDHRNISPLAIRKAARSLAAETMESQKAEFRKWAIMADWDNAYVTMDKDYEIRQLEIFAAMAAKGLIYRRYKPVWWSPSSGTALAEAEVEYDDQHVSLAAFLSFPLTTLSDSLLNMELPCPVSIMVWTTTPWTLPANKAIAVNKDMDYCLFRTSMEVSYHIVAKDLLAKTILSIGLEAADIEVLPVTLKGSELLGSQYTNTLRAEGAQVCPVLDASFVTASSGTGSVHMAPGHGFDDYLRCHVQGLEPFSPVDDSGRFTASAYPHDPAVLEGIHVLTEGSEKIIDLIKARHATLKVWAAHRYTHKYPIDWRTKLPILIRSTAQWFADVDSIKDDALMSLQDVTFIPETGRSRLSTYVKGRTEWCISRQRSWGVPIPVLYRSSSDPSLAQRSDQPEAILTAESVAHIIEVLRQRGTDAWWTDDEGDQAWVAPDLPAGYYRRGIDTMDVWFDSGTSWASLPQRSEGWALADLYLEGSDQHRGWFQSSLLTRIALQDGSQKKAAPFRHLLTHGFLLDGNGRKMSKSLGNVISPDEIMNGSLLPPLRTRKKRRSVGEGNTELDALGPDALRIWAASSDYTRDVLLGVPAVAAANAAIHKFRITFKFLLGVLSDYDTVAAQQASRLDTELKDHIALHHLSRCTQAVHKAYLSFEPYRAMQHLNRYVSVEMSSLFLECAKDPLYAGTIPERLLAQRTSFEILHSLMSMLVPVTPLLIAEVMEHTSQKLKTLLQNDHLDPFRQIWRPMEIVPPGTIGISADQIELITSINAAVKHAQEEARDKKLMASSLECRVSLHISDGLGAETLRFLARVASNGQLASTLVVQNVRLFTHDHEDEEISQRWCIKRPCRISGVVDVGHSTSQILVSISPSDGHKCPRCWRFSMQHQAESDNICARCSAVMGQSTS